MLTQAISILATSWSHVCANIMNLTMCCHMTFWRCFPAADEQALKLVHAGIQSGWPVFGTSIICCSCTLNIYKVESCGSGKQRTLDLYVHAEITSITCGMSCCNNHGMKCAVTAACRIHTMSCWHKPAWAHQGESWQGRLYKAKIAYCKCASDNSAEITACSQPTHVIWLARPLQI